MWESVTVGYAGHSDSGLPMAHEQNLTYAIFYYSQVAFPSGLEAHCIGVDGDMARSFATLASL